MSPCLWAPGLKPRTMGRTGRSSPGSTPWAARGAVGLGRKDPQLCVGDKPPRTYRCSSMLALVLIALALGMSNLAASIGIGVAGPDRRLRLRIAVIFGAFEGAMPAVGLLIGHRAATMLGGNASTVGGTVLALTGLCGIITVIRNRQRGNEHAPTPSLSTPSSSTASGWGRLTVTGIALSIDNLVVGFALGAYHASLAVAAITIAAVSVAMSLAGLEIGGRLSARLGHHGELFAGAVLLVLGVAISRGAL